LVLRCLLLLLLLLLLVTGKVTIVELSGLPLVAAELVVETAAEGRHLHGRRHLHHFYLLLRV